MDTETIIFTLITLCGGLALFLFGMNIMSDGLERVAGGKLEKIFEKITSNRFKSVALGAGVTSVIQSSTATTVMVVGFVNSGLLKLRQAIGVIMGANIGTTVTSWLLSLAGIEGDNFFIKMLKPSSFSPILAVVGIILLMFCKSGRKHDVAYILLGFATLMFGMTTMTSALDGEGLAQAAGFKELVDILSNPVVGLLAGALLTALIHSSSASVGILQAVAVAGLMPLSTAIPIILGQNIGTCATALISSIGANKNARRAAVVHLYFNLIGSALFITIFYSINAIIGGFSFMSDMASATSIAIVHSVFNIFATFALLPFVGVLEKLALKTIKDDKKDEDEVTDEFQLLDDRFLSTPSFAIEKCKDLSSKMATLSRQTLEESLTLLNNYNKDTAETVILHENRIDTYEDKIGTYLVKLSSKSLSMNDSRSISLLLHCISDFERISDHAVNVLESAEEMQRKELDFSPKAREEIRIYINAISEILNTAVTAFVTDDIEMAKSVEPLEEVIDGLRSELKKRHIKRLRKGKCTIEMGFVLSDLLTNFERVADHCSNIAVCLIQIRENSFDTHEYLNELKKTEDNDFAEQYNVYREKYMLP